MNLAVEPIIRKISSFIPSSNDKSSISIALGIVILSTAFFFIKSKGRIMDNISSVGEITRNMNNRGAFRRWIPGSGQMEEEVLKRGGNIAGLVNDGNTCFMNCVLQSMASSKELLKFLDHEISCRDELIEEHCDAGEERTINPKDSKQEDKTPDVAFSMALKELLDKLNAKYYRERPYFKANKLLKSMSKAPNKNLLLGYDQEDAQEFFQTMLSELEKNAKSLDQDSGGTDVVSETELPASAVIGQAHLDHVGAVYIPTEQVDPNMIPPNSNDKYFTKFKLIIPLDGITAERIGCLQCGETGGIRYSVSSGLSLNLPSDNIGSSLKLSDLLKEYIKPEIIEGVECNRCALLAVRDHLVEQLRQYESKEANAIPAKLSKAFQTRIQELEAVLSKPVIDDEEYKKLHTENMVRKCSKSKQVLISRPAPLLAIHINRSVFDPRTFMIRKNNARVLFKSRLNLSPWCCDIDEINMDARLPMSKKEEVPLESSEDENVGGEYYSSLHQKYEREFDDSDEESDHPIGGNRLVTNYDPLGGDDNSLSSFSHEENDQPEYIEKTDALGNTITEKVAPHSSQSTAESHNGVEVAVAENLSGSSSSCDGDDENDGVVENNPEKKAFEHVGPVAHTSSSQITATPLTYSLRSVVVHYGTHNYGHYIAFRKYRGCWWRISDENVYIVDETEVLSTPGVFMLFYEYDYDETTGQTRQEEWEYNPDNLEIAPEGDDSSLDRTID